MSRVDEIVRKIRREIEEEERRNPSVAGDAAGSFPALRASESLEALNRSLAPVGDADIRSHRRWLGPFIVAAKRVVRRVALAALQPEIERERETLRGAVRFANEVAARCDELARDLEAETTRLRARLEALEEASGTRPPSAPDDGE